MIVKIVKLYLALSLVLWAVWGHFQGDSLCLTSSVCWSLQCLISVLTQGGQWWTHQVHYSVALWGGRDAANKYYWRVLAVSHPLWACPCSWCTPLRLYVAPPGNRLRPALGFMHLPGLSHSGSVLRKPSEAQIWLGLRFVPFPGPSSSGVWRAQSLRLMAFPSAQFSGCTTGVPSQVDDDCPEPQEVLVSKEACFQFGR